MSQDGLFLLKLDYQTEGVGGGSMTLQLAVDPVSSSLNGRAQGTILDGTRDAPSFTASASGHYHATGFGEITKVGAVSGQAAVSVPPPQIGTYLAPFSATFAVDDEWNGTGSFSVGHNTYPCRVTNAG